MPLVIPTVDMNSGKKIIFTNYVPEFSKNNYTNVRDENTIKFISSNNKKYINNRYNLPITRINML